MTVLQENMDIVLAELWELASDKLRNRPKVVNCLEEKYRVIINASAKKTRYPIVALSDKQAVLVEGAKVQIIGEGKKEFWNGFRETI